MTPAKDGPARLDLRIRASVVVDFDLDGFTSGGDDAGEVMAFLDEDCERVRTPAGHRRWAIKDSRRAQTLTAVPLDRLRAARGRAVADTEATGLQRALDRSLGDGWRPSDLDRLPVQDARSVGVVAGWWSGGRDAVPSAEAMAAMVGRLALFADVRAMATDHFVGRRALLATLRDHFRDPDGRAFVLHGLGGIGKSAVVARHVVWALDRAGAKVALLDFDDATLNPMFPADLVNTILDRVARQVRGASERGLVPLSRKSADVAQKSYHRVESSSRTSSGDDLEWQFLLDDVLALTDAPVLVVFDTFEGVQRRGPAAVSAMLSLVTALLAHQDRIRVVISGRAEVGPLPARSQRLAGLERPEAMRLLAGVSGVRIAPDTADAVIDLVGTSPLTVRLAAQLLAANGGELGELFALDLQAERIEAELYRRLLGHIEDERVARLAHPGLILRRITADLIQRVLARACGVPVRSPRDAEDLFQAMANERMLVDRTPDGAALVHRPDLRAIMLPQLLRSRPDDVRRIQRAAVRYYARRDDPVSRVEELYHRLMLEQSAATLAARWDSRAAEALALAMDELPRTSRALLARHLPDTYLSDEDRRLVSDTQWAEEVQPQVLRLLAVGDPRAALGLLGERRTAQGGSLLPALEIEALERVGDFERAIGIARERRRAAAACGDVAKAATFNLHLSRLLERAGRAGEAVTVADEALATIREPTLDRLRLLVCWLGLHRRLRPDDPAGRAGRQREAIALYRELGPATVREVPGLLRDLAAEVGTESPRILADALQTLGLDAYLDGPVPTALADLDRVTTVEEGAPEGMVADLARLEPAGGGTDWNAIVDKSRGETGSAISEVLDTFSGSARGLRHAVANNYQIEADAALLGHDLTSRLRVPPPDHTGR